MTDDVAVSKADTIRRCLRRVGDEYRGDPGRLDGFTVRLVLALPEAPPASLS